MPPNTEPLGNTRFRIRRVLTCNRSPLCVMIPSRLQIDHPLGPHSVQIVRKAGVVFPLEEIVASRLAARDAGGGVQISKTRADLRIEKRPANAALRHGYVAVIVK